MTDGQIVAWLCAQTVALVVAVAVLRNDVKWIKDEWKKEREGNAEAKKKSNDRRDVQTTHDTAQDVTVGKIGESMRNMEKKLDEVVKECKEMRKDIAKVNRGGGQ